VIKGAGDAVQTLVGKRRLRAALVVVQIALSLVLVVGAGLFLRSLSQLRSVDPTLANDRIVAATLNLTLRGYTPERGPQLYEQLLERARAIPGIQSASLAYVLPVTAGGTRMDVAPGTTKPSVDTATSVEIVPVSSGFFQTVGIPLLRGRDFGYADGPNAPPAAIVNETLKRRFWPDMEAVGQSFSIGGTTYEIAGVARDTKYRNLREQPRMTMYLPLAQSYESSANLLVKTAVPVEQTVEALRRELRAIDPALPLYNVRTLAEHVDRSLYLDRLRARLISWLAALALSLAAIGVYGVVSYSVAERTREVGIRLALGAHPRAVLNMILGAGTRLAAIGVLAGLLLSLWLTRLVATELYGVEQMDPLTLIGASALLVAVVALASFVPAWRATRIDPIKALRYE
jgi:putative ABC transport system permease protein